LDGKIPVEFGPDDGAEYRISVTFGGVECADEATADETTFRD